MKLLLCKSCSDVIKLITSAPRRCACGKVGGQYDNDLEASYWGGDDAVPLGFSNSDLAVAIRGQQEHESVPFKAFVIEKDCLTFVRKKGRGKAKPKGELEDGEVYVAEISDPVMVEPVGFVGDNRQ